MKNISGDMILPKFGEYKYYTETGIKPEHILLWICDSAALFKKETKLLIKSGDINLSDIDKIDIIVGSDHGQGAFRFPMKMLYIMNNEKSHESIQLVGYILCKKDKG